MAKKPSPSSGSRKVNTGQSKTTRRNREIRAGMFPGQEVAIYSVGRVINRCSACCAPYPLQSKNNPVKPLLCRFIPHLNAEQKHFRAEISVKWALTLFFWGEWSAPTEPGIRRSMDRVRGTNKQFDLFDQRDHSLARWAQAPTIGKQQLRQQMTENGRGVNASRSSVPRKVIRDLVLWFLSFRSQLLLRNH